MSYLGGRTIYIDSDGNEHFDYERDYEPKPTTNYDRIVSKSPEELADWLNAVLTSNVAPYATIRGANKRGKLLDWLKQGAEEGE
jgi:hypothetical protein